MTGDTDSAALPVVVALATPADLDAVVALLVPQFSEHGVALPLERLRAAVRELLTVPSRGAVLLARRGAIAVGVAVLATTWTLEHGGLVGWLDELYVVPEERGQGIGAKLLDEAVALARRGGWLALELEVERGHERAANLYERAGFRPLTRSRWSLGLARAET